MAAHRKSYSVALLMAGIVLIAASCVPLAQTLWFGDSKARVIRLALPTDGGSASMQVSRALSAVPVIRIEAYPAVLQAAPANVKYSLSITDSAGDSLIRREGSGSVPRSSTVSGADRPATVDLPLHELSLAPGSYTVRFETVTGGDLVRRAELRMVPASTGLLAPLLTALMLAILGWLTASLGALQWVRTEAARPVARGRAAPPRADEERLWTVLCHLSALLGYLLPFGHVVGPLAVWLAKRRTFPAVEQAGREVLNFQLSITLYVLGSLFLSFFLIGIAILFLVVAFHFSAVLYASLRAQRGQIIQYPLTIKLI